MYGMVLPDAARSLDRHHVASELLSQPQCVASWALVLHHRFLVRWELCDIPICETPKPDGVYFRPRYAREHRGQRRRLLRLEHDPGHGLGAAECLP